MTGGIHETAIIDSHAEIDNGVIIGPYCVIGPGAVLAKGVQLHSHVNIMGDTYLKQDVEVFPGCVLGAPPQIVNFSDAGPSRLEIGARTVLREHVTVHLGAPSSGGLTTVGEDCMLMIGCHIAHDCHVGDKCVIANSVHFAGHVTVGEQVWIGGLVAIHQFSQVGKHAFLGGGAIVMEDVIPYGTVIGNHAHLAGLNMVGLKRRGFSRDSLQELRAGYKMLFADKGNFASRVEEAAQAFQHSAEVMDIVAFIQSDHIRPICQPE